jgi:hypothetical protein
MERWPEVTEGDGFTTEALRPCREILLRVWSSAFGVDRSAPRAAKALSAGRPSDSSNSWTPELLSSLPRWLSLEPAATMTDTFRSEKRLSMRNANLSSHSASNLLTD